MCAKLPQLCLTLWDPMDYNPPGSSVQARILEWVATSFTRRCSQLRDRTWGVSCGFYIVGGFFTAELDFGICMNGGVLEQIPQGAKECLYLLPKVPNQSSVSNYFTQTWHTLGILLSTLHIFTHLCLRQIREVRMVMIPILQMRKWRTRIKLFKW